MKKITGHAYILFAVATIAFGIIQITAGNFNRGLLPVPETLPARKVWLFITATLLMLMGSGLLFKKWRYPSSVLLGIFYFLLFLLVHFFPLISNPYNPNEWTAAVEVISLSSGAFFIAAMGYPAGSLLHKWHPLIQKIMPVARYAFSGSLLVFAFLHFTYAAFIATLIPAWVPFKLFLAMLIGAGFLAAAISIMVKRLSYLSASILGCMFLLWVFILHLPRAMDKMTEEPEWTSLFVALAFSGASWMLAFLSGKSKPVTTSQFLADLPA